jgi:hypothetical protein
MAIWLVVAAKGHEQVARSTLFRVTLSRAGDLLQQTLVLTRLVTSCMIVMSALIILVGRPFESSGLLPQQAPRERTSGGFAMHIAGATTFLIKANDR